jgi:sulfide dehydrogenase cytochrome subunit
VLNKWAGIGVGILLGASHAYAATSLDGQRWAASCASCHGTNGNAVGNLIPALAGMPKERLMARMQEFKAGARQATVMQQIAKGYGEQEIEAIATFFAQQPGQKK